MPRLPPFFLAVALLTAGCATRSSMRSEAVPATRPANVYVDGEARNNILVLSAAYGSGDKFADVTYRVNDLLRDPETVFWAKPRWLGADPTPGWNKALVIVYEHEGRRRIFSTGEGGEVSAARLSEAAKERTTKGRGAKKPGPRPGKAS